MFSFFSNLFTFGLVDAVWSEVWKFGLGTGVIILSLAAAWLLSPIGKQTNFFLAVAACCVRWLDHLRRGDQAREADVRRAESDLPGKQLHHDYIFTPRRHPVTFNPFSWFGL